MITHREAVIIRLSPLEMRQRERQRPESELLISTSKEQTGFEAML